jgi:hypothetical protein
LFLTAIEIERPLRSAVEIMWRRLAMLTPKITQDSSNLLAVLRDLYSKRPETYYLEPYELQSLLWSLSYCDDLIPEPDIAATVEVARTDLDPDDGAA